MVKKVAQRAIAAGLAGMMSFGAVAPAAMALDIVGRTSWWDYATVTSDEGLDYFTRIAGTDRYETMKKIVKATYNTTGDIYWNATTAVVASGENFPDALAANGLAGALNGGEGAPVILTKKNSLTSHAKELLKNLQVQTVYIMGGTAAVSQEVEDAIRDLNIATIRVAGADRQATSVQAFKLIDGNWYKKHGTHSVIIATGANYADALSISPFAYATGTPIILTKADGTLTDEAVKAIKDNDEIWQVIVVGGTAAVSENVFGALGTYNGSYKDYYKNQYVRVRIAGADRYDTSAYIADWECNYAIDTDSIFDDVAWADFDFDEVFVATGENFPDALAGGQLAGGKWYAKGVDKGKIRSHSPILLTKDGNRAADMMIAQHLSWNSDVYAVDATLYADFSDYYFEIAKTNDADKALEAFVSAYEDGFWTLFEINPAAGQWIDADGMTIGAINDYGRSKFNTFHGVILGGKAAVSKDKAKQLDQTVSDNILKYTDGVSEDWYHIWFKDFRAYWTGKYNYNTQIIAGVTPDFGYYQNKKLVDIIPGDLQYFYMPIGSADITRTDITNGKGYTILEQTYVGYDIADYATDAVKLVIVSDTQNNTWRAGFVAADAVVSYNIATQTITVA
jgi:putative cell wall-binding protein